MNEPTIQSGLENLSDMDLAERRSKYTSVPEYAMTRRHYSDTTSNLLTRAILRFLELMTHPAWRQSSEGRWRPGKEYINVIGQRKQMPGSWLPSFKTGQGDITAIIRGRMAIIEVKIGRDKQSKVQSLFQQEVEKAGGRYVIVGTFEEFINAYNNKLNKP